MAQKLPNEHVNFSQDHPLKDVLQMLGVVILSFVLIFISLTALINWLVPKISFQQEKKIFSKFQFLSFTETFNKDEVYQEQINHLLQSLALDSGFKPGDIELSIICKDENNALVYPGGKILVYKGLLKTLQSENELAMVLGHEIGHIKHRDHLKGLGVRLSLGILTLFLPEHLNTYFISNLNALMTSRYSRIQEEKADYTGIELLHKRYGHAKGAVEFFKKISLNEHALQSLWASSHPHSEQRVKNLNQYIKAKKWQQLALKKYDEKHWDKLCQSTH